MRQKLSIAVISALSLTTVTHAQEYFPESQFEFVQVLRFAKAAWEASANEIQREPMRRQRDERVCHLSHTVSDWTATVNRVSFYLGRDDLASLSISFGSIVTLRTEGDLMDAGSKIERGTPLFDSVATLHEGQSIRFSGEFLSDDAGCPNETSFMDNGSMTAPEYLFKFTSLEPQ